MTSENKCDDYWASSYTNRYYKILSSNTFRCLRPYLVC
eukprot:SAG31_NODE_474_length_15176_cov_7.362340_11_plen_38_part_00